MLFQDQPEFVREAPDKLMAFLVEQASKKQEGRIMV
jgi:hypothetical protein